VITRDPIVIHANPEVHQYLQQLVDSGLYGTTVADAAERIVCVVLEDMLGAGRLKLVPRSAP
jgi:hypothetical protein